MKTQFKMVPPSLEHICKEVCGEMGGGGLIGREAARC